MGWKRVKIFLSSYYNPQWTLEGQDLREPHDNEFFTHKLLFEAPIKVNQKTFEVKE